MAVAEKKYDILTQAIWAIGTDYKATPISRYGDSSLYYSTRSELPNPHIFNHSCIGEYNKMLTDFRKDKNITSILYTVLTSSITFNQREMLGTLVNDLTSWHKKCIYNKSTGEIMTPIEAVKEIEQNETDNIV